MVAQVQGCYGDVYAWENLYLAYTKAARGKRGRNVIEPAFEASFIHHSYANRAGKGTHRASSSLGEGPLTRQS